MSDVGGESFRRTELFGSSSAKGFASYNDSLLQETKYPGPKEIENYKMQIEN
jgi:hypothetical protein